jgi:hypothetical protein
MPHASHRAVGAWRQADWIHQQFRFIQGMGDLIMNLRSTLSVSILAAAAALSVGVASAESTAVKSNDVGTINKSYGRAGGLVGSDRVKDLRVHTSSHAPLGVSWDAEVAARTNMPADRAAGAGVGVSYDHAVAERTNMPRGTAPVQAADVADQKTN